MIYINENTTEIRIPKVEFTGLSSLVFTNQVTGRTIMVDEPEDLSQNNVYYTIDITDYISEFINGQYDYYIKNNDDIVASGIAQFGEYVPEIKTYQAPINEIKTYER